MNVVKWENFLHVAGDAKEEEVNLFTWFAGQAIVSAHVVGRVINKHTQ